MRILLYELKKLWNWRILALIAVIGALTWFAFLSEALRSYDSLTTHGIYGSYQNEMFTLYGEFTIVFEKLEKKYSVYE